MTGYAGSQDYVGTQQSPQKTPHRSTHPTEKHTPTLSQEFCADCELFELTSNPHRTLAKGSESVFQWDVRICVGSSEETAGSLRNPETRRTPSYIHWAGSLFCLFKIIFRRMKKDGY